jgi:hypothetical protein
MKNLPCYFITSHVKAHSYYALELNADENSSGIPPHSLCSSVAFGEKAKKSIQFDVIA